MIIGFVQSFINGIPISRRAWKNPESLRDFQNKAIHEAVSTAYNHTDFYYEKYKKHGVHPDEIRTIDDLLKLPIITKNDLINNFESAIPRTLKKNRSFFMGTSGTTGQPIKLYKDHQWLACSLGWAFRMQKHHKLGFPKVAFIQDISSSTSIESNMQTYMNFSSFNTLFIPVEEDIVLMMKKLEESNINYIVTYPGVMRELATLRNNGMGTNINLIKVGLSGELLDEYTREYIEDAFDCKCFNSYISTEGGPIAMECVNKKMHINNDFVTVEIVDENGEILPPGNDGHILLTCHDGGYGTPIIRYNGCSDVGQILAEKCGCGMNTPIMGPIKGRVIDSIHLPDGRIYHAFAVTDIRWARQRDVAKGRICQYQIVQHEIDKITVSIVRNNEEEENNDSLEDIKIAIIQTFLEQFGPEVKITVIEVDEIPKSDNIGIPTPLVISKLNKIKKAVIHI